MTCTKASSAALGCIVIHAYGVESEHQSVIRQSGALRQSGNYGFTRLAKFEDAQASILLISKRALLVYWSIATNVIHAAECTKYRHPGCRRAVV